MMSPHDFLSISAFLLIWATYARSGQNFVNLLSNIKWLFVKNRQYKKSALREINEKFIICIPMLREQRVVSDTLKYFSRLSYPKTKYKIVVVTTEKEIKEKSENSRYIKKLAESISKGTSFKTIREEFIGVFPSDVLEKLFIDMRSKKFKTVLKNLKSAHLRLPTTYDLAEKEAKSINGQLGVKLIAVINYPYTDGVMSHQINYAVKKLAEKTENTNAIFAVYNADSRPHLNTLKYVSITLKEFENQTGVTPNIVQQSSLFTLNYNKYPNGLTGYILRSAALFQTKWTLVRELSRFRSQSKHVIEQSSNFLSKIFHTKISHCVGHGLFVRLGLLANEYLPTETINEDLPFGFYQCCKGEPILPLPVLENSETTETMRGLINQKRFWFTPYLQYMTCRNRVLSLKNYRSRFEVELLTMQAEITGLIWLIQSFVLFAPLIIAIYLNNSLIFLLWSLGLLSYWFLPVAIIYAILKRLEKIAGKSTSETSLKDYMLTSFSGLYVLLTHSYGPLLCIRDFVMAKLFDKQIIKLKTER